MKQPVEILEYNAFTEQPFAGNPAGVVTDGAGLDEKLMQLIARQLNLSETAFLVPPSHAEADVRIRWFTPTQEVTLCGHATIAAFTAAAERGLFPVGPGEERSLRVETLSGVLRVRIERKDGGLVVSFQLPMPRFEPLDVDRAAFAQLWGASPDHLQGEPWLRSDLNYWYIPVSDLKALRALRLDTARLAEFESKAGFAFFTSDTVDPDSHWHLRFFAPFHGVAEDPVTGSAQGPMGVIHLEHREPQAGDGWFEFRGEQGDHLGQAGRVCARVRRQGSKIVDLEIAGTAESMLEGKIRV